MKACSVRVAWMLFLVGVMLLLAWPAAADDDGEANRLLVEAVKLIEQAVGAEEITFLRQAVAKLHRIIGDHPSSAVAVKLVTGDRIGFLVLVEVEQRLVEAQLAAGDISGALSSAEVMSAIPVYMAAPTSSRDRVLNRIARAYWEADDREGVMATVDLIKDDGTRNEWLEFLAKQGQ